VREIKISDVYRNLLERTGPLCGMTVGICGVTDWLAFSHHISAFVQGIVQEKSSSDWHIKPTASSYLDTLNLCEGAHFSRSVGCKILTLFLKNILSDM
jgi:hypothetical protein